MATAPRTRVERPGWWWSWATLPALCGLLLGLAPVQLTESTCGAPMLPTGVCNDRLTLRLGVSLALLGIAFAMFVIGVVVSDLSIWRLCQCVAGIVTFAACSYVALRVLTLEGGGAHCNMYLTRSANDRAQFADECNAFWSSQLRRSLWAMTGMALGVGLVVLSFRRRRGSRGVPSFVPDRRLGLAP